MRKTNLFVRFVLLTGILILFASNAYAFLITSELNAFTNQLVPATPSSTMSVEWGYSKAYAEVTALQESNDDSSPNRAAKWFDEPSNTSLETATDQANIIFGRSDNDASFDVDFGEDTLDYLNCDGHWKLSRFFKIHGEGWLLISAVHAVDYESTPSFDLDFKSSAGLSLWNYSSYFYAHQLATNYIRIDSSELTDFLGVGQYYSDGDWGYLHAALYNSFSNSGDSNPVPIPSAAWLFVCGLSCLVAAKKIL